LFEYLLPLLGLAATGVGVLLVYRSGRKNRAVNEGRNGFEEQQKETGGKKQSASKKLLPGRKSKRAAAGAQDFLGFDDVRNGLIRLSSGECRMILEVQGMINFRLMSHSEQVSVEDSFASFLSGLDFPVQFYVQSRLLDMRETLAYLQSQLKNAPEDIRRYGIDLMNYLEGWVNARAVMVRRNYLVAEVDADDPERSALHVLSVINGGLARCGLKARRLSTEEILEMLYVTFNKSRAGFARASDLFAGMGSLFIKGERNPLVKGAAEVDAKGADFPLREGVTSIKDIAPDGFLEKENHVQVGSRYTRIYSVTELPPRVHVGFLEDLYTIDDVDVSFHLWPAKTYEVINQLTRAITKLEAQRIQDERRGDITSLSVLQRAARDLWQLREKVQTNEDRIFYASVVISVSDDSLENLDYKCRLLESRLGGRGVHVRSAFLRQAEAYRSSLPLGNNEMWDMRKNFNLGAAVSIFPFENAELAHPGGVFIGVNKFTQSPVFFNPFIGPPVLNNRHFVILAQPGSGKSYLAKGIASRSLCMGVRVVFIDPEGEYAVLTKERGGRVISFKAGSEPLINPFDLEEEEDADGRKSVNIPEKILEMKRLIRVMIKGANPEETLTTEELAGLEEVLASLYAGRGITEDPASLYERFAEGDKVGLRKKEMPTISDLVEKLREEGHSRLATVLVPYTRGRSLGLFDGQSRVNLSGANIICFDFKNLEEDFMRPLAMHVALSWIWEKFVKKNEKNRKMVICDEAWMYMQHKDSAEFLNDAARRGRKRNLSLGVVSQYPQEFINSDEGRAVLSSAATKILMRQSPNDVPAVREVFNLNEGQARFINSCAVGEALILCEGQSGVFSTAAAVEASPEEDVLFNTDPERAATVLKGG